MDPTLKRNQRDSVNCLFPKGFYQHLRYFRGFAHDSDCAGLDSGSILCLSCPVFPALFQRGCRCPALAGHNCNLCRCVPGIQELRSTVALSTSHYRFL